MTLCCYWLWSLTCLCMRKKSPSGRSQWTLQWSPHHLDFYPSSGGIKEKRGRLVFCILKCFAIWIDINKRGPLEPCAFFKSLCIQNLEELVHMFIGCFISHTWISVPPHHVINWLHNCQHFLRTKGQKQSKKLKRLIIVLCGYIFEVQCLGFKRLS